MIHSLLSIISFASFSALLVGLFKPESMIFWQPVGNRKRIFLLYYFFVYLACTTVMWIIPRQKQEIIAQKEIQKTQADEKIDSSLIFFDSAQTLYKNKKYKEAIQFAQKAEDMGIDARNTKDLKAQCKKAMNSYSKAAPTQKANKKVIGYCSVCRDGTISNAVGRGACSHHGGVVREKPIYE